MIHTVQWVYHQAGGNTALLIGVLAHSVLLGLLKALFNIDISEIDLEMSLAPIATALG